MALPKVTPGTYDYGAYARPTMVRYKGGQEAIGEAIGSAIGKGVQAYEQRKGEIKAADNWKTDTVFKLTSEIDSETLAQNEMQIKNLTNEMGELGRLKMLGKIPGEEYTKRMVDLNNTFKSYRILGTDVFEAALEGEIDMTQFKGEDLDRNAGFNRAVSSGNLKTNFDPTTGKATATWTGASGKEFTANLNDIVNNAKDYLNLDQRFDFRDGDKQELLQKVANQVNSSKDIKQYMTEVGENASGKFEMLNNEVATEGISKSSFIDGFVDQYGKDIFEDVVKPSIEGSTGKPIDFDYKSEQGQEMIRKVVAAQVAGKVQQTGNKVTEDKPTQKEPQHQSGFEIDDRRKIADNVTSLGASKFDSEKGEYTGDSPFFQIKLKGPSDPSVTTYKFRRLEDGKLYMSKPGQPPRVITEEELYRTLYLQEDYNEMTTSLYSGPTPMFYRPDVQQDIVTVANKLN